MVVTGHIVLCNNIIRSIVDAPGEAQKGGGLRLSLRFVLPLLAVLALVAYLVAPLADSLALRWFVGDLKGRAALIARTAAAPLNQYLKAGETGRLEAYFARIVQDERLFAAAYCDRNAQLIATPGYPPALGCADLGPYRRGGKSLFESPQGPLHVAVSKLGDGAEVGGELILIHDMSFIERRSDETRWYLVYLFLGIGILVSLITVAVAQLSWRGWLAGTRALLSGEGLLRPTGAASVAPEFRPLERDLRALVREVTAEHRSRDESRLTWSAETLREILRGDLSGEEIIVVSNREPYSHAHKDGGIVVERPASGLVTALEPVLRACSGTWVAHGSGSADRETVDEHDRVAVPPDNPAYRIRRVWLSDEEQKGYYDGFANEGMWPLCHFAHVRPTFRTSDWVEYQKVNRKFADAVVAEASSDDPIVLVQDYHFALLPRMIRERLPKATIITFWHIPWPNPESFAVCPWSNEILEGLLGSSILGFHTQFHCNNFIESVDRGLEARVDRETNEVSFGGMPTAVCRYPISIDWPPEALAKTRPAEQCRAALRQQYGLAPDHALVVGADRLDYTKGILERFLAIERFLERWPERVGRFSFVQVAAPTRASVDEYQSFEGQVRSEAARINARFTASGPAPIILAIQRFAPEDIYEHYRAADACIVSSLHDGMNLVAKEFVASREDEAGVLILSRFTGAARELPEAVLINPYDIDQFAGAIEIALAMPPAEQRERMRVMRGLVAEFNVFRWAGRMLLDGAQMRRRARVSRIRAESAAAERPR